MSAPFILKQYLGIARAVVELPCEVSMITILHDKDGTTLPPFLKAISEGTETTVHLLRNGEAVSHSSLMKVGFGETLSGEYTPVQTLLQSGISDQKLLTLLEEYELRRFSSMSCAGLNATAAQQIKLLKALEQSSSVLVLNDPFLPFSGRWREHFAHKILEYVREKKGIVVITNLSFFPKSWEGVTEIQNLDIPQITHDAMSKALAIEKRAEQEAKRKEANAETEKGKVEKEKTAAITDEEKALAEKEFWALKIPGGAYIAKPLAEISNTLRSYSGVYSMLGIALLVCLMGFVMFPELQQQRAKLATLGNKVSWTEVLMSYVKGTPQAAPKPVVEVSEETEGNDGEIPLFDESVEWSSEDLPSEVLKLLEVPPVEKPLSEDERIAFACVDG